MNWTFEAAAAAAAPELDVLIPGRRCWAGVFSGASEYLVRSSLSAMASTVGCSFTFTAPLSSKVEKLRGLFDLRRPNEPMQRGPDMTQAYLGTTLNRSINNLITTTNLPDCFAFSRLSLGKSYVQLT